MKLKEEIYKINKLITELSPKSSGVQDFIDKVKDTPGLVQYLDFNSIEKMKEYISDGSNSDFNELRDDAKEYENLSEKEKQYYIDKENKKKRKKS